MDLDHCSIPDYNLESLIHSMLCVLYRDETLQLTQDSLHVLSNNVCDHIALIIMWAKNYSATRKATSLSLEDVKNALIDLHMEVPKRRHLIQPRSHVYLLSECFTPQQTKEEAMDTNEANESTQDEKKNAKQPSNLNKKLTVSISSLREPRELFCVKKSTLPKVEKSVIAKSLEFTFKSDRQTFDAFLMRMKVYSHWNSLAPKFLQNLCRMLMTEGLLSSPQVGPVIMDRVIETCWSLLNNWHLRVDLVANHVISILVHLAQFPLSTHRSMHEQERIRVHCAACLRQFIKRQPIISLNLKQTIIQHMTQDCRRPSIKEDTQDPAADTSLITSSPPESAYGFLILLRECQWKTYNELYKVLHQLVQVPLERYSTPSHMEIHHAAVVQFVMAIRGLLSNSLRHFHMAKRLYQMARDYAIFDISFLVWRACRLALAFHHSTRASRPSMTDATSAPKLEEAAGSSTSLKPESPPQPPPLKRAKLVQPDTYPDNSSPPTLTLIEARGVQFSDWFEDYEVCRKARCAVASKRIHIQLASQRIFSPPLVSSSGAQKQQNSAPPQLTPPSERENMPQLLASSSCTSATAFPKGFVGLSTSKRAATRRWRASQAYQRFSILYCLHMPL